MPLLHLLLLLPSLTPRRPSPPRCLSLPQGAQNFLRLPLQLGGLVVLAAAPATGGWSRAASLSRLLYNPPPPPAASLSPGASPSLLTAFALGSLLLPPQPSQLPSPPPRRSSSPRRLACSCLTLPAAVSVLSLVLPRLSLHPPANSTLSPVMPLPLWTLPFQTAGARCSRGLGLALRLRRPLGIALLLWMLPALPGLVIGWLLVTAVAAPLFLVTTLAMPLVLRTLRLPMLRRLVALLCPLIKKDLGLLPLARPAWCTSAPSP